jgi:outer membrane protein
MRAFRKFVWLALSATATAFVAAPNVEAEPIESALARAYEENPQLNAQRASVRATDEYVPQALSGYRPKVGAIATVGEQRADLTDVTNTATGPGNAKCVQRVSDGQPNSHGGKSSYGSERGSARPRANHSPQ